MLSPLGSSLPRTRSRRPARGGLAREAVVAALGPASAAFTVEVLDAVDSTSSELLRRAEKSDVHRHALAAEHQTEGRGRRGRAWTAIAGGSLVFSLGWRFEQGASELTALPLAVGLAVAEALDSDGFAEIALKWPNDLVHRGRKLGGVLVELSGNARGPSVAIIGIGLNVRLPRGMQRVIGQPATDLASAAPARRIDRNALLGRLLVAQARMLERYASTGFAPMRAVWQRRHALHGETVHAHRPDGGTVTGIVAGVEADGALRLSTPDGIVRFVSGEVSLRRP